eukprot:scaffold591124_cov20-Prasinocladus_malaysianus.AAC.1
MSAAGRKTRKAFIVALCHSKPAAGTSRLSLESAPNFERRNGLPDDLGLRTSDGLVKAPIQYLHCEFNFCGCVTSVTTYTSMRMYAIP